MMTSYLVYSWQAVIFTLLSGGYCWPSVIPVLKVHLSDLRMYYSTIIIIRCKFFPFSLAESPPANYCLRIMFCSCAMSSNCVWLDRSCVINVICLSLRIRQIIDLLATDNSRYFVQSRPITVNSLKSCIY